MEKVMLDILLPATGKHYDFWVPESMQMQTASQLISKGLQQVEPDFYAYSPDAALMLRETGELQNPAATVSEVGLTNGDELVLV